MTVTSGRETSTDAPSANKRSLLAAGVGNALEWFDWTLYATFSVYLAANFFDKSDPTSAMLSTLAVFAVGFIARPIGGFVFGRLGDRVGRKVALIITMSTLALTSLAVAVLPTFEQIGVWASALLVVVRLTQGLAHGGEVGVSYTYVAEIAPNDKRGLWSSSVYVAVTVGVMAATASAAILTALLSADSMGSWGWRIGFAIGGVLGIFALYLRRAAVESETFTDVVDQAESEVVPAPKITLREVAPIALRIIMFSAGISVGFYVWVTFAPSNAITNHGMNPTSAFVASLASQAVILVLLPLFGALSDRIGRKPMVFAHGAAIVILAFPIAAILGSAAWTLFVAQLLGLIIWALVGAVYPALVSEQAPTRIRASTVGFVTSLSVAIFGGTGPYLMTWLNSTGHGWIFTLYLVAIGFLGIAAAFVIRETKGINLSELDAPMTK